MIEQDADVDRMIEILNNGGELMVAKDVWDVLCKSTAPVLRPLIGVKIHPCELLQPGDVVAVDLERLKSKLEKLWECPRTSTHSCNHG